jgi:protein-disulfide isomerase
MNMVRKKSTPKPSVPVAAFVEPMEKKAVDRRPSNTASDHPYSLAAMLDFMSKNAGLLFLGMSIFIVGFLVGAMWRENTMLKSGVGGSPTAQLPGTPTGAVPEAAAPAQPLSDENWKAVQENPAGVVGNKNAKVTIVEFTDYQCPFCSRHYNNTHKALKEKYIDTGKVKIIFKDQALPFHANAKAAAQAARCAGDQGKFEAMHDALFEKQTEWSNLASADAVKKFGEYAQTAGMNSDALTKCINDGKYVKAVEADSALGVKPEIGAGGTPTFFIEKQPIVGAQDLSVFEAEIEKALK